MHKNAEFVLTLMKELKFKPLMLPVCSSTFNSCEQAWSVMKRHFNCILAENRQSNLYLNQRHLESMIQQTLTTCASSITQRLYYSCCAPMSEELRKHR